MLIGLHGKKQAGKDTVYERLAGMLGHVAGAVVERASFADLLYKSAAEALGLPVELLRRGKSDDRYTVQVKAVGTVAQEITFREYLQRYGTEAHRRVFGDNFWVDNINLADHAGRVVVVTDVRFANEAQAVIDAGGSVVQVVGPPHVENTGDGHASEERLPTRYIDHVLYNTRRDDGFHDLDFRLADLFLQLHSERGAL